ncbi:MAG: hypothetical protein P4L40_12585 [Terracidiphilus sp.]|nr:hypothetical protein [Terracidiphilus sp.]
MCAISPPPFSSVQEGVAIDGGHLPLVLGLAESHARVERHEDAIATVEGYLVNHPPDVHLLLVKAYSLLKTKR